MSATALQGWEKWARSLPASPPSCCPQHTGAASASSSRSTTTNKSACRVNLRDYGVKGRGLYVTERIAAGDIIFSDAPTSVQFVEFATEADEFVEIFTKFAEASSGVSSNQQKKALLCDECLAPLLTPLEQMQLIARFVAVVRFFICGAVLVQTLLSPFLIVLVSLFIPPLITTTAKQTSMQVQSSQSIPVLLKRHSVLQNLSFPWPPFPLLPSPPPPSPTPPPPRLPQQRKLHLQPHLHSRRQRRTPPFLPRLCPLHTALNAVSMSLCAHTWPCSHHTPRQVCLHLPLHPPPLLRHCRFLL